MSILVLLLALNAQSLFGLGECVVVVDVVDPTWDPLPGIEVVVRDERTGSVQARTTGEKGTARVVVQSCSEDRCRFSISAGGDVNFKKVTLKHLWFGRGDNRDRHVQIRLANLTGRSAVVR
jgi:hypothetical protein